MFRICKALLILFTVFGMGGNNRGLATYHLSNSLLDQSIVVKIPEVKAKMGVVSALIPSEVN